MVVLVIWPCWVFLAAHRHWSSCSSWAPYRGLGALGTWASVLEAPGLENTGSVAVTHGLRCPTACMVFLDQGWNQHLLHWNPAGFFTTEPPGKSLQSCFNIHLWNTLLLSKFTMPSFTCRKFSHIFAPLSAGYVFTFICWIFTFVSSCLNAHIFLIGFLSGSISF